jgi:hypothetical protein
MAKSKPTTDSYNDLAYRQLEANKGRISVDDDGPTLVDGLISGEPHGEGDIGKDENPSLRAEES